ncbi:MAG TPA: transposase [Paenibacillus sp.]
MTTKDQKYKTYTEDIKREAIRLHVGEKSTYPKITEHFGIQDKDQMKVLMRKYRKQGEFSLLDQTIMS